MARRCMACTLACATLRVIEDTRPRPPTLLGGGSYITALVVKKGIHTVLVVIHSWMNHLGFTFTLGISRAKTWTTRTANPLAMQVNSTA
jgi:hypothetical protein